MAIAKDLLPGIATLLWPIIVLLVLFLFRPAVEAIIESAKSRKFTLKIGGQELSMEEANEAQQKIITDLQTQVAEIQKQLHPAAPQPKSFQGAERSLDAPAPSPGPAAASAPMTAAVRGAIKTLLWVDDHPENNKYYFGQLSEMGIEVDAARSTADALARIANKKYDCILSDMGRQENGLFNSSAGLDLLRAVRARDTSIPLIFFTSQKAIAESGQEAMRLGATALKSSQTRLLGLLNVGAAGVHA
jgi:CheY-like chemotaxis protein